MTDRNKLYASMYEQLVFGIRTDEPLTYELMRVGADLLRVLSTSPGLGGAKVREIRVVIERPTPRKGE